MRKNHLTIIAIVSIYIFFLLQAGVIKAQSEGGNVYLPIVSNSLESTIAPTPQQVETAVSTLTPTPTTTPTSLPTATPTESYVDTEAPNLFTPSDTWISNLGQEQLDTLDNFISAPDVTRFSVVESDATLFNSADKLDVNVFEDRIITISKKTYSSSTDGYKVWIGEEQDNENPSIFIVEGDGIYGSIYTSDKEYQIDTMGSYQIVTERAIDVSIPDEPPYVDDMAQSAAENIEIRIREAVDKSEIDHSELTEIALLVPYTEAARDNQIDIEKWIQLRVEETNVSFKNSGILARIKLVDSFVTSFTEAKSGEEKMRTDLEHLMSEEDEYLKEVHQRRAKVGADIIILVSNSSLYKGCGIAATVLAPKRNSFWVG